MAVISQRAPRLQWQGCLLSPFIFLLAIDWILKKTTAGKRNGIQWTLGTSSTTWILRMTLPYSHTIASRCMRKHPTSQLSQANMALGYTKTNNLKIHTTSTEPVKLRRKPLEEVESMHIHDANLPFHHIPKVLYWIEIWWLWRPFE